MHRACVARYLVVSFSIATAAMMAACGSGSLPAPTAPAPPSSVSQTEGISYRLGWVAADSETIANMSHIRSDLSVRSLPATVDLAPRMPPVGNQGQEGACVAWASAYALRGYEARRDVWSAVSAGTADPAHNFSPAFVYNQLNGGRDGGSTIPGALSLLQHTGAATLADMPYVPGQYLTQPSGAARTDAARYRLASYGYLSPSDLTAIKTQLASGLPVVMAIKVYANFFTLGRNAVFAGPAGAYVGGHAVSIVGYDDAKGAIKIINSWGTGWGTAGYGWIAYAAIRQIGLEAYSAIDDHGLPPAATL